MRPLRSLLLVSLLAIAACADGGSRGSGITTAQGNVSSVQTALRLRRTPPTFFARLIRTLRPIAPAFARSEVEGIRVDVEGTGASGQTDAAGLFAVSGSFGGNVTLHFQRADDGLDARLTIDAPAGGTVTLTNVRLGGGGATVERRDVSFGGRVAATNCAAGQIAVVTSSGSGSGNVFTVRIGGASIHDDDGNQIACRGLRAGDRVAVEGSFNDDGTISARDVKVRSDSSGSGGGGDEDDGNSGPGGGGSNSGSGSSNSGSGSGDDDGGNSGPGSGGSGSGGSGSSSSGSGDGEDDDGGSSGPG